MRHQINNFLLSVSSFALLLVGNNNVSAQTSSPGTPIIVDKVTVSSQTPANAICKRFDSVSGGVSGIDYHEMLSSFNLTMSRALLVFGARIVLSLLVAFFDLSFLALLLFFAALPII
ncbi:MAG: hypothetical protein M3Z70_10240 [Bartonella sp.]|nr:hypothetical protein [Bartonella sp.]